MIIFDTCELRGLNNDSPKYDLLRAVKHSGLHRIAVPWMVREELIAQQVIAYRDAHTRASEALSTLNRKTPWRKSINIPRYNADQAKSYWQEIYDPIFEVIETSGQVAKLALAREAYLVEPAKRESKLKTGARDAAIWLSLVDYLSANPTDEVVFVSGNTRDFGDGSAYPEPMSADLGSMKSRLTHITSFETFVSRFTKKIDVDLDRIQELLRAQVGGPLNSIGAAAVNYHGTSRFAGTRIDGVVFESVQWQSWLTAPLAMVDRVSNAVGHRIGEEEWYTATVDWILVGFVAAYTPANTLSPTLTIACRWHTKILFSTGAGRAPSIVYFDFPEALGADISPKQLVRLKEVLDETLTLPEAAAYFLTNEASWPIYSHDTTSGSPNTASVYPLAFARPDLADMFRYRGP